MVSEKILFKSFHITNLLEFCITMGIRVQIKISSNLTLCSISLYLLYMKFDQSWPSDFRDILLSLKMWMDFDGQMDAGPLIY